MAKAARPTVVTVMGILNIVFGSIGLLCGLCGLAGIAFLVALAGNFKPPPGEPNPMDILKVMDQTAPWLKYYLIGDAVKSVVMTAVLLVSGIGLLNMKRWGRTGSIFYAVVTIFTALAGMVVQIVFVMPLQDKMEKNLNQWVQEQEELERKKEKEARGKDAGEKDVEAAPAPVAPAPMFGGGSNPVANVAQELGGMVLGLTYAIALLVVMMLKDVRRAFAIAAGEISAERDREYDDSDDRRRPDRDTGTDDDEGWGGSRRGRERDDDDPDPDEGRYRERRDY